MSAAISGTTWQIVTQFFCACNLWQWLGPHLATLGYVMYFLFY